MLDNLIQIIAPHHCYYCDKTGDILCAGCMYDITFDAFAACFGCTAPSLSGVCPACQPRFAFSSLWVVTERRDQMKKLLDDYKFERLYGAFRPLTGLLDARLPLVPADTVIVPIPTIARHIRQRGYDHTKLIARHFARSRGLHHQLLLKRKNNSVQVGANEATRRRQARDAFYCPSSSVVDVPYLIIDDIITTGATVIAAAQCLRAAGARQIMIAAVAH